MALLSPHNPHPIWLQDFHRCEAARSRREKLIPKLFTTIDAVDKDGLRNLPVCAGRPDRRKPIYPSPAWSEQIPRGGFRPTFAVEAENVFTTLEAILGETTLEDVANLNSYHVGEIQSQLREFMEGKGDADQAMRSGRASG